VRFYQERYGELLPEIEQKPGGRRTETIKYNLVLENLTDKRFKLNWLGYEKNKRKLIHYGWVNPYETKDQATFAEHA
jgi:hypothetical protein